MRTRRTERVIPKAGNRRLRRIMFVVGLLLVLSVAGVALWKACFDRVYRHCRAEAGAQITAADFMKKNYTGMIVADMGNPVNTSVPGVYQVYIQSGRFTYHSELEVVDTVAPVAETVDIVSVPGQVHTAEEFVRNITDATAVSVRFAATPLFDTVRNGEVFILLTDAGGNVTELMAHLNVVPVLQETIAEAGSGLPDTVSGQYQYSESNGQKRACQSPDAGSAGFSPFMPVQKFTDTVNKKPDAAQKDGQFSVTAAENAQHDGGSACNKIQWFFVQGKHLRTNYLVQLRV